MGRYGEDPKGRVFLAFSLETSQMLEKCTRSTHPGVFRTRPLCAALADIFLGLAFLVGEICEVCPQRLIP